MKMIHDTAIIRRSDLDGKSGSYRQSFGNGVSKLHSHILKTHLSRIITGFILKDQ